MQPRGLAEAGTWLPRRTSRHLRSERLGASLCWGAQSGGDLGGIVSQREKRSPRVELSEMETLRREEAEARASASRISVFPYTHRVRSKRRRSSCSYRPAQAYSACTPT